MSTINKSPLTGGKTKFLDFFFIAFGTKSWEKSVNFKYGLPLDFWSKGQPPPPRPLIENSFKDRIICDSMKGTDNVTNIVSIKLQYLSVIKRIFTSF